MTQAHIAGETTGSWLEDRIHRNWLKLDFMRQADFFAASLGKPGEGFHVLDLEGRPIAGAARELHATTRMVHSYALARAFGWEGADRIIDAGMDYLWNAHRDPVHGGYVWALRDGAIAEPVKLAYGHVFVLLAACSALESGHPDARRLLDDVTGIIDRHFMDAQTGLLRDEFDREWKPFSTYRGMNANMHGAEAMLAAYEATGERHWLEKAGAILGFFTAKMAPAHGWRIPEHYTQDWEVDAAYAGNPMFRPAGTTPGHSLEFARLALQHWDLAGRPDDGTPARARHLVDRAFADAWRADGGFVYTLDLNGKVAIPDRYWWPVTEAIGACAMLSKLEGRAEDEARDRMLWQFAADRLIDHGNGGWFPELDEEGRPTGRQFTGKPDIYHSIQATLFSLTPGLSRVMEHARQAAAG